MIWQHLIAEVQLCPDFKNERNQAGMTFDGQAKWHALTRYVENKNETQIWPSAERNPCPFAVDLLSLSVLVVLLTVTRYFAANISGVCSPKLVRHALQFTPPVLPTLRSFLLPGCTIQSADCCLH